MELRELTTKEEMMGSFDLLKEVYPTLSQEDYERELDDMIPHNYGQLIVLDGDIYAGITGYWIGTKLWCGKYLELDNVVVNPDYRRKGIGQMLFQFMENKAKEIGCTMLALDSYSDNFSAHKFFYSQDYVPRGFHFINILDKKGVR
ncbi:MAG: GNAT superfamily N-acetyltransferase [Crocinitomicaceae bacterium]|jgi:GNAT superfamily N-acetyltransferase